MLMEFNYPHDSEETERLYTEHHRIKPSQRREEFESMTKAKQIPSLPEAEDWDEDKPPFSDLLECTKALLTEVCRAIDQASTKWDVAGPCSVNYEGNILHFVGLEPFKLEAVRITNFDKDFGEEEWTPKLEYYLRRLDSAVVTKFYGLSGATVEKMFGSTFMKTFNQMYVAVSSSPKWQKAIAEMTRRKTAERYAGTGMEFGGW